MSGPTPVYGVRAAATARATTLNTRTRFMRALVATLRCTAIEGELETTRAHRTARLLDNRHRLEELAEGLAKARAALALATEHHGPIDAIERCRADLAVLERARDRAFVDRSAELVQIAARLERLELDLRESAVNFGQALVALGMADATSGELMTAVSIPGLEDMLAAGDSSNAYAIGAWFLAILQNESTRADADLVRVGESPEYDRALTQMIEAEGVCARAARRESDAQRERIRAAKVLTKAESDLRLVRPLPGERQPAPSMLGDGPASGAEGPPAVSRESGVAESAA